MPSDFAPIPKKLLDKLENEGKSIPTFCIICHSNDVEFTGLFFPNEEFSKQIGVPPGKQRIILYACCSKCFERLDRDEVIDNIIATAPKYHVQ